MRPSSFTDTDTEKGDTPPRGSIDINGQFRISDPEGNVTSGQSATLVKSISHLNLLSAAWNILNTWWGYGSVFILGISQGGPITLIYGMMLLSLIYGATALSLAELSAKYPSAGGQYHWASILAPKKSKRILSYCCAVANIIGRLAICAGVTAANAQFILGLVAFNLSTYEIQRWHVFVLYQAMNIVNYLYNAYALHRLPWTHHIGCILSIVSFFIIIITCLAMASPKRSSEYVWTTFVNESGWSNTAIVFLTGLVSPNFGLGGLDGPIHLAEDTPDPARSVPLSILVSVVMGCVSALAFVIVMLYCITDIPSIITSRTGVPLFEMWFQATSSVAVTNAFIALFTAIGLIVGIGGAATASRLTWSFARDNMLWGSKAVSKIDPKQRVPVNAVIYNAFLIALMGCLYIASTTAFNSLCGTGALVEQTSFAIPVALLMWQQRQPKYLPQPGKFNMGRLGWLYNGITVAWTLFITVIYSLPPRLPVTAGNMNYTCVVLAIIAIAAAFNWRFHTRYNYTEPKAIILESE